MALEEVKLVTIIKCYFITETASFLFTFFSSLEYRIFRSTEKHITQEIKIIIKQFELSIP